jgi:glutamate/tyrosine decarboxylase-like PLP-dependent enzyme
MPPEDELARIGDRVVSWIANDRRTLPERPVFQPFPADLAQRLAASQWPADEESADAILDEFEEMIGPYPFGNGHPRFYGWVNSPPDPMGVFAEALAAAMNPSCAGGNHAAIHVERAVVRWLAGAFGFPDDAGGLLVSGGSMAALTALAVARHLRAGVDVREEGLAGGPRLRVYRSAEGHGCYQKAVELLGLGRRSLHAVATDASLRMIPAALAAAIEEDLARGERPLAVVASAGTVNTGAIDPLAEIADVCARYGVWLHVDGAYGAPAVLSGEHRPLLAAMARADSLAVDPHKWLYVPVECGLVLVKDAKGMRDAFSLVPPYLRTEGGTSGVSAGPWLSEYGFQQTRGFRALKLWMALKRRGVAGYGKAIAHDIAMARHLASLLRASDGELEVWEPQGLSIVCFRCVPAALRSDEPGLDTLNRSVVERVQLGGKAFLSSTVLGGRFYLRACVVNPRATESDLEALVATVREAARI